MAPFGKIENPGNYIENGLVSTNGLVRVIVFGTDYGIHGITARQVTRLINAEQTNKGNSRVYSNDALNLGLVRFQVDLSR